MRGNVAKCLPVLRRQIEANGWPTIRALMAKGSTKGMSAKDRREALRILDKENKQPTDKE